MTKRKNRKGWTGKLLSLLILATTLLGLGYPVLKSSAEEKATANLPKKQSDAARVYTVKATKKENLKRGFELSGTLEAFKEVTVKSKLSGRIDRLKVSQGDLVEKGQIVAELDHREQDAVIRATKAQIASAIADRRQAEAELKDAERELKRYRKLLKEGYSTQQDLDQKETTWESARASWEACKAAVEQYEANLNSENITRSEYILRSPFDGTVLDDYSLTEGTMIDTSTSVMLIGQVNVLKATAKVPEAMTSRIKGEMTVTITGDSSSNSRVDGKIYRISPYVDTSTRTLEVEVTTENSAINDTLKPGMFVKLFFVEEEVENPLTLPKEAIDDNCTVMAVTDGKIWRRNVSTGLIGKDDVQILSGLSEGDEVVISGGGSMEDGTEVETTLQK